MENTKDTRNMFTGDAVDETRKPKRARSFAELLYGPDWRAKTRTATGEDPQKKPSPQTPYKENLSLSGKGEGKGKENLSLSGKGEGKENLSLSGKGEAARRSEYGYEDIMDERCDAVELALAALRIPRTNVRNGKRYNNARILRWSLGRVGEETFRETLWRQLRENETDGLPRSTAAAFQGKLNALMYGPKGDAA